MAAILMINHMNTNPMATSRISCRYMFSSYDC
jgi:hypothetical protein